MARSPIKEGTDAAGRIEKPVPPPMQSVIKGGWTYRIEDPIETSVSALKELAQKIRADSWAFVRNGPEMLSPSEINSRRKEIEALAGEIEHLAAEIPRRNVPFPRVTKIISKLHSLGFFPNGLLVENVTRAFVSAEKFRRSGQSVFDQGQGHG